MMINKVTGAYKPLPGIQKTQPEQKTEAFSSMLKGYLSDVNEMQFKADEKIQGFITGKVTSVDEVMTTVQEANMAFQLLLQIRNKLVDAYQEIMRTPVG